MMNKKELIKYIKHTTFSTPGSSGKGRVYHEIPFEGYSEISVAREENMDRLNLLKNNLNLKNKKVLDIGCSVGFYSFSIAKEGADVWGVDLDSESIFVANQIKDIENISNVNFKNRGLTNSTIDDLLEESGGFDVVLIFSVIHWLIKSNRNLENVKKLLRRLIQDGTQVIYEPAISDKSYYPDILKEENVRDLLFDIGLDQVEQIGSLFANNINSERKIYKATVNYENIVSLFEGVDRDTNVLPPRVEHIHKEVFKYGNYIIKYNRKTNQEKDRFLFQNEARILGELQEYSFAPRLYKTIENDDQTFLIMENLSMSNFSEARWLRSKGYDDKFLLLIDQLEIILAQLHDNGLTHNDIRPENLMISENTNEVKLIDYQFCSKDARKIETYSDIQSEFLSRTLNNVGGEYYPHSDDREFKFMEDRLAVKKILNELTPQKRKHKVEVDEFNKDGIVRMILNKINL